MELGNPSIRLEADGVHIVPSRWQRLRGATPQRLPYAALVGVSMKEPKGLTAGQLLLRGRRSSDTVSVRFGSGQVADMHHVASQLWERIRKARETREGGNGSPQAEQ